MMTEFTIHRETAVYLPYVSCKLYLQSAKHQLILHWKENSVPGPLSSETRIIQVEPSRGVLIKASLEDVFM